MSHANEVYEHPIEHHEPREGFDKTEPDAKAIWGFTVGSVITLVLVIVAVQVYFESIYKEAVFERVLSAPSVQLQDLLTSERAPVSPDWFIVPIGESVLDVELEIVDFKTSQVFNQFQQGAELGNTTARDIEHDAAAREIGIIPDD